MMEAVRLKAGADFSWDQALLDLGWLGDEAVDLGWTIVGRHVASGKGHRTAVRWIGTSGIEQEITFAQLDAESARVANTLMQRGVQPGDRVAMVLPRLPSTVAVIIGILRSGAVLVPIFSGFGIDAISYRLSHSRAKIVITAGRYRSAISPAQGLEIMTLREANIAWRDGDADFLALIADASGKCLPVSRPREAAAAIIYTSGSTGRPKGCVIAANFLCAMWPYARFALDLREDDLFWPTGDPSWGYGLCCYLPALALGIGVVSVETNASAELALDIVRRLGVTNLATTPTVLRSLMAEPDIGTAPRLRAISSCGEPLNESIVNYFGDHWGVLPMDHFGATEFGLPICNHNAFDVSVKPGSMGIPSPGQHMAVIDDAGVEMPAEGIGLLAQRPNEGSRYFLCYWEDPEATAALRHGEWICTGDLARRDAEGYFWFEGRSDDIIKTSGYRVGPFEVESAILKHDKVVEVAAIGVPDPLRGQVIKAFVVLAPGTGPGPELEQELVELVRVNCGKHSYPRLFQYLSELPKTDTGKIRRFMLRNGDYPRRDVT